MMKRWLYDFPMEKVIIHAKKSESCSSYLFMNIWLPRRQFWVKKNVCIFGQIDYEFKSYILYLFIWRKLKSNAPAN